MRRVTAAFPWVRSPLLLHLFLAPEDAAVATPALGVDGHAVRADADARFPDRMYGRCRVVAGSGAPLSLDVEARVERTRSDGIVKRSARYGSIKVVRDTQHAFRASSDAAAYTAHTDLVYFDAASALADTARARPSDRGDDVSPPQRVLDWTISDLDLFRFSALTYNAHRIHWDRAFAPAGLVVHGTLLGLYGLNMITASASPSHIVREYEYELQRPLLIAHEAGSVAVRASLYGVSDSQMVVTIRCGEHTVMRATATLQSLQ